MACQMRERERERLSGVLDEVTSLLDRKKYSYLASRHINFKQFCSVMIKKPMTSR